MPIGAGGGEASVFTTAPLGKTMAASDNAEIDAKEKEGIGGRGKKIQETLKMSEISSHN